MTRSVVHFIDTVEFGGAERAVVHLLNGLDRSAWRSVLFHHDEPRLRPLLDEVDAAGIERRTVGPMRGARGLVAVPAFARALRSIRPDVFHAHLNWPLACSGGILAAAVSHVPAVVATVQLFSEFPRAVTLAWQRRLVTAAVDRYIAVSDAVAREVEQRLHVPPSKVRVVRNGVVTEAFDSPLPRDERLRVALAGRPDRPIVLTLARLHEQKGLTHLVRAAASVPDAMFIIAGEGPERAALEAQARAHRVQDRVAFIGFRADTAALLASADLFVLPSLNEGLPLSVLEAMMAERPVIATAVGGTGEVVRHRQTGLLVSAGDSPGLAAAIRELIHDVPLAHRLARAGRDLVRQQFSSAATANAVAAVYDELLDHRQGALTPGLLREGQ